MDGKCCDVLKLVLSREPSNRLGVVLGTRMNMETGDSSDALVVQFRKAKKDEPQKNKNATFAWCRFCPFCGEPTDIHKASIKASGEVAATGAPVPTLTTAKETT